MVNKKNIKKLFACTAFLIVGYYSTAQVDSANKNTATDSSSNVQTKPSLKTISILPTENNISFYHNTMQMSKNAYPFSRYNYVPVKNKSSIILSVAGSILLTYMGEKTHHPYRYSPGN